MGMPILVLRQVSRVGGWMGGYEDQKQAHKRQREREHPTTHLYLIWYPAPARVYKIATGGDSDTTGPSENSYVGIPASSTVGDKGIFSGVCDATTNRCYWAIVNEKVVAKTFNGVGAANVTYEASSTPLSERIGSIALDAVHQHLYVGTTGPNVAIYKMSTGNATSTAPQLLQTLTFDSAVDGKNIYAIVVDPATGYGFMGTSSTPSVVKFSMDGMSRIGNAAAPAQVYGLGYNPVSGYVYTG